MGRRMRIALIVSALAHLALLVWGFLTLTSRPFQAAESIPVDVVSATDLSTIMKGVEKGKKTEAPKPVVDKIGDDKPVKDPTLKVSDKPEIAPSAQTPPPPPPEAKPPEPKPEKAETKPETKPEPKPEKAEPAKAETKPEKVEPQVDEIAEALKREEAKKKEEARKLAEAEEAKKKEEARKLAEAKKKEEARKREEAKRREHEQQEKFNSIENRLAALVDKRAPQRQAATGGELNPTASLGAPNANAPTLSVNELAALQARLRDCWEVPVGVQHARDLVVTVRIQFRKDGSLAADPIVLNRSALPLFQIAAEAATRGIRECAPYSFMPPAKYEAWKDVEVNFDPREMFGG